MIGLTVVAKNTAKFQARHKQYFSVKLRKLKTALIFLKV